MPTYVYVQNASGEILYSDANGQPQGIDAITWNGSNLAVGATLSVTGVATFPNTGLHLLDTDASHDLIIAPGSNLTADRTLTIATGDADRTLTISGSTTLGGGTHSGTNTGDQTTAGTANEITVTNGSTSPVISLPATIDLGGKTSLEIPNGTSPTVDAAGEIAIDTDADGNLIDQGLIVYHDGVQKMYVVAVDTLPSTDDHVLAYDATADKFVFQAQSGGGGGAVATDTIWDAKGDLAVGTGADTAQKLTVGADGKEIVADSTQTTGLAWKTRQTVVKDICGGRLSLESAVAISSSDQSGKSTIYYVEHASNEIALYDGTEWVPRTFNNISVAVPSTLFRLFDIFAYDNSGTVTLETVNWNQDTAVINAATTAEPVVCTTSAAHGFSTGDVVGIAGMTGMTVPNGYLWNISVGTSTTFTLLGTNATSGTYNANTGTAYKLNNTRATALALQDGVLVKSGDATRRYLGTGMTGATSGQMDDSLLKRMLYNFRNQVPRAVAVSYSSSHPYSTNTTRLIDRAAAAKLWFVLGQSQDIVFSVTAAADGTLGAVGVSLNSIASSLQEFMTTSASALFVVGGMVPNRGTGIGGHFAALTERAANSTSVQFCIYSTTCRVFANLMM